MKAVTSALAGGVIAPGKAATIAAELAMPDLDLIKQAEQGCGTGAGVRQGPGRQSRRPAARLVVDTFVRAIETSDFERRLQLVEADCSDHPVAAAGMYGAGAGEALQPIGEICAADSLCMAGCAIAYAIRDCHPGAPNPWSGLARPSTPSSA